MYLRTVTRALVIGMLALLGFGAVSANAQGQPNCYLADLACERHADAAPNYIGWGRALDCNGGLNGDAATLMGCPDVSAWRWNGAWQPAWLRAGSVYVYPYATGWRWVWTAQTGWLALKARHIAIPA